MPNLYGPIPVFGSRSALYFVRGLAELQGLIPGLTDRGELCSIVQNREFGSHTSH